MKCLFALLVLNVCSATWSVAAPLPAGEAAEDAKPVFSRIDAVTVYADRARVTRIAPVEMRPEAARFAFAQLPGWIDEGSIRVSLAPAEAGRVLDVQVRRTYLARAGGAEIQKAEAGVRETADQLAAVEDEKAVLDAQTKQVDSIRMFSLEKLPKDVATREIKPEEYGASVKFIISSLREVAQSKRELEKKRRDLEPELAARTKRLNELRERAQLEQCTVVVTLQGAAQSAKLALSYMLPGATWEPLHELRASLDANTVSLASFALIMQTTGEDWIDATLSLSTQSSTETMRIPELEALLVGGHRLPKMLAGRAETFAEANKSWAGQNGAWFDLHNPDASSQSGYRANQAAQLNNAIRIERVFENLQQRGTTAHFPALTPQTVRSDGRPTRAPIGNTELVAQHRILAAPELSLNAANLVDLSNSAQQPLLPGRISLFLDGAFLGLTETEFVAPGENFSLYLGAADQVKLSRTLDKKRSVLTRGGAKTRMQVSFLVEVENLSGKALGLQLADRVPVSESDEIRVSSVKIQPEGKPDGKGLLRWDLTLAAKQNRQFRIDYTLEYPSELPSRGMRARSSIPPPAAPLVPGTGLPTEPSPLASPPPGIYDHIKSLERRF